MKTIAVCIDEITLAAIDDLTGRVVPHAPGTSRRPRGAAGPSRSEIVRRALQEFLARRQQTAREDRERRILAQHRESLARQAAALVAEQATP